MDKNWELLIPQLTNYYLHWKYPINAPEAMEDVKDENHIEFEIKVVDIHTTPQSATIQHASDSQSPSLDLIQQGFIGNKPQNPTIAVFIQTMELLQRIRRRKPGFSVEAFAKVVCDIYMVHYI